MKPSRFITLICAFICGISMMLGQTPGDKYFSEGQKLHKTMTVNAQQKAIEKFTKAKQLYDSAANKKKCDDAIDACRELKKQLEINAKPTPVKPETSTSNHSRGDKDVDKKDRKKDAEKERPKKERKKDNEKESGKTKEKTKTPDPTLSLSNTKFDLDLKSHKLSVNVTTNQNSWNASPVTRPDGSSFLSVNKTSNNSFEIIVRNNPENEKRIQKVVVSAGGISREIEVHQTGQPVFINVNNNYKDFKAKGGDWKIEVSCNANRKYSTNYNENWYIKDKPEWILVKVNEKRDDSVIDKAKDKIGGLFTGKKDTKDGMVDSSVTITAERNNTNADRSGEIIFCSGSSTVVVRVTQKGK